MEKRLLALLSLVGLVILAGCIGGIGQPEGVIQPGTASGVVIKSFGPDLPEVFSGDSVTFTVLVENIGELDATTVRAKLYGLGTPGWDWTKGYQDISDNIPKAQPSMGVPGGQGSVTWDATSPIDLKVDKEYTANVRVTYGYGTSAVGSIKVYNSNYLKTITQEEASRITTSSGLESWKVSNSPIAIELAGAARPFIVKTTVLTPTISLLISNRGQGYPYSSDEGDRKATITSVKVGDSTCVSGKTITIPRTGKTSVTCKFSIDPANVPDFTTTPIEVELTYNYYVDDTATVKVLQTLS